MNDTYVVRVRYFDGTVNKIIAAYSYQNQWEAVAFIKELNDGIYKSTDLFTELIVEKGAEIEEK